MTFPLYGIDIKEWDLMGRSVHVLLILIFCQIGGHKG